MKIMSSRKEAEISPGRLPGGGNSRFVRRFKEESKAKDTRGEKRMMGNLASCNGQIMH